MLLVRLERFPASHRCLRGSLSTNVPPCTKTSNESEGHFKVGATTVLSERASMVGPCSFVVAKLRGGHCDGRGGDVDRGADTRGPSASAVDKSWLRLPGGRKKLPSSVCHREPWGNPLASGKSAISVGSQAQGEIIRTLQEKIETYSVCLIFRGLALQFNLNFLKKGLRI